MKEKQNSSKQKNHKGFTLIELLVVVLIIGILAAIALPQYKKVVLKSRFAAIKDMTRAIYDAEQRYYLLHNQYTTKWKDLDIEQSSIYCNISSSHYYVFCSIKDTQDNILLQYIFMTSGSYAGKIRCNAYSTDQNSLLNQICQMETGKKEAHSCYETYCAYYQ